MKPLPTCVPSALSFKNFKHNNKPKRKTPSNNLYKPNNRNLQSKNKSHKKYNKISNPYPSEEKLTPIMKINQKDKGQDKKNKRKPSTNASPVVKKLECQVISVSIAPTYFANSIDFPKTINAALISLHKEKKYSLQLFRSSSLVKYQELTMITDQK